MVISPFFFVKNSCFGRQNNKFNNCISLFFGGNLLKRRVGHYQAINAAKFCAGLRDIHRSLSPLIFEKNPPNIPGSKIKISDANVIQRRNGTICVSCVCQPLGVSCMPLVGAVTDLDGICLQS